MSDDTQDPQELLVILASIKAATEVLAKQKIDIEARLIDVLDLAGKNDLTADTQNGKVKGTIVRAERVIIDGDALRNRLKDDQWERVTKEVVDNGRLEAAVTMGIVDEAVVAACSEVKQNKPYVKLSGDLPTITGLEPVATTTDSGREKAAVKRVKAKKAAKAAGPQ